MSFFNELKRRKVFRAAIAYVVGAWVFVQVADVVADNFNAPDWVMQMIIALVVVGLPVTLILSWVFDLTPDGIVRARDSDASEPALSDAQTYSLLGGMIALVIVVLYMIWPQTSPSIPTADGNSIAVLPFANDSLSEENAEFIASGMHDELLARLADITPLKVISRTSVMAYRDSTKNVRQIGEELGVVYLLEGRVQRAGDRLRIILQLVDSTTDEYVWQDTYDREMTAENIFALQAEMATSIATELQQTLSPALTARLDERPTQNTRAFEFYLSGDAYLKRRQAELAIRQFGRAVEEDPNFALAWAGLSRAHSRAYWGGIDRVNGQHLENARDAAAMAFELEPRLPEAHFAMGYFYMYVTREHEKSLEELAFAARGMPGSSDLQETIAEVQRRSGDFETSIATLARAIELDPRNTRLLQLQAANYAYVRDSDQFKRHLDRVLEIEPDSAGVPGLQVRYGVILGEDLAELRAAVVIEDSSREIDNTWFTSLWQLLVFERDYEAVIKFLENLPDDTLDIERRTDYYAITYQLAGQPDLAGPYFQIGKERLERQVADQNWPEMTSRRQMSLAQMTAGLGDYDEASRLAEEAMALNFPDEPMITNTLSWMAAVGVFIPAGDYDRAIELLDEHFVTPAGWTVEGVANDPRIDPIRDQPGWLALVEKHARQ